MSSAIFDVPAPWDALLSAAGIVLVAIAAGLAVHFVLFRGVRRWTPRGDGRLGELFARHCSTPAAWILPLTALAIVTPALPVDDPARDVLVSVLVVLLILASAWFVIRLTRVFEKLVLERYDVEAADNLQARKVHTQTEIVRKILVVVIAIIAFAGIFLTFDPLRRLGAGILASAGLAGLVIGLAAQRTLGNLLAGFQIALTQPIRIDDVVVVEGEWGRIEEITLTYVVVRIWDLRRLVLPISYFLEKPFQNWTRTEAQVLGTVFLEVDYRVPADAVRERLGEILAESPHFDGEVWRLHVTEAGGRTVQMRALMSAGDSPTAWELRCEVREKLLRWLREAYPEGLPRLRAELEGPVPEGAGSLPQASA